MDLRALRGDLNRTATDPIRTSTSTFSKTRLVMHGTRAVPWGSKAEIRQFCADVNETSGMATPRCSFPWVNPGS